MTSRRVHGILGVALVLSVSVVLSGPSGVRAERYAVAAHFEPPVTINLTAETDAWAVVATAEGRTGGSVTLYRNGTFVSERNWGLQEVRFLEGGVNHRFDFSGPPFRFLVANSSLTRQWQRNWHLDVLLYSPQAILIEPDQDYWASTGRGRYVPYEELAVRVTMSGDIIATIYTQLLVPISSGAAISAQRERQYFVSFNATTWPARLICRSWCMSATRPKNQPSFCAASLREPLTELSAFMMCALSSDFRSSATPTDSGIAGLFCAGKCKCCEVMASPLARMTARCTTFSSSRALPGQG